MAGEPNLQHMMSSLFRKNPNEKNDRHEKGSSEKEGKEVEKQNNKEKDMQYVLDENKKQDIWSLFPNLTTVDPNSSVKMLNKHEANSEVNINQKDKKMESFTKPKHLNNPLNKNSNINALFKKTLVNKQLAEEVEYINKSNKTKNRILLSSEGDNANDNILSSIITAKKFKANDNKETMHCSAYNEFFNKPNSPIYKALKEGNQSQDNALIKDATSKLKEDFLSLKKNKELEKDGDTNMGNKLVPMKRKIPIPPMIKRGEVGGTKTVLKKKNICVPVNDINEKQLQQASIQKIHVFNKNDKFDIFSRLGDDVFRYILIHLKNKKNLLSVNKRFSEMLQQLRNKLIYMESLKNTITPESIIKTIYASPNIEVLDLSGCSHMTAHHFSLLANSNNIRFNRSLKILCLKNCNKLTDSSLKIFIQRFKNLKVVDIRNCYKISYEGIYPLRYKTTLTKLYLGNTTSANITNNHSNDTLKVLFGSNDVSSVQLDCPLKKLVCFEITYTKALTDLSNLFFISQNIKILNLKGCNIDDSSSKFFKTFINLLALNVAETKFSNNALNEVMLYCKNLKVLDISKTHDILHKSIVDIAKNFKQLRKLKIAHLSQVDNFCVREILKNANHLLSLDFSNCWKVNNAFCDVNGLEIATGNNLKDIGAFQCSIDKNICETHLSSVGCTNVRIHIYNELKLFETSIYNDIELLEAY